MLVKWVTGEVQVFPGTYQDAEPLCDGEIQRNKGTVSISELKFAWLPSQPRPFRDSFEIASGACFPFPS